MIIYGLMRKLEKIFHHGIKIKKESWFPVFLLIPVCRQAGL
jgi:hypothetical protein